MGKRSALYLTRNGMLEPLGQSQVLSYLHELSDNFDFTLVSFEKPEDLADSEAMEQVEASCKASGIRWLPQRFARKPPLLAPAWSMVVFLWICLREIRAGNANLIHARSYIPAIVALSAWKMTKTPFIFDMRALWPEELITAGRLKRNSIMHRLLSWSERKCLKNAAGVVSLTHAAVGWLKETYPQELAGKTIHVIPTCANLTRFSCLETTETELPIRIGCCGTVVSGWFRLDWLLALYVALGDRYPEAEFEIVTRDPMPEVQSALVRLGVDTSRISIYSARPDEMPGILRAETANVMFYAGGSVSELGRSPTRMAEVLGCGRPVIANRGVGDVAEIVERYQVGVLMDSDNPEELERVVDSLAQLLQDPELPARCRKAAEEVFSLEAGVERYRALYDEILS